MASIKSTIVVAGLNVNIFSDTDLSAPGGPLAVLFLLHGRTYSAEMLDSVAESILRSVRELDPAAGENLLIATFDHRNHGSRLVNAKSNADWIGQNERHAVDMYAIQTGTASDVSFLIDFLPPYLFPSDERKIVQWMVAGISLGGHSTWIALKNDSRIRVGIPIIGCPDYLALTGPRAKASSLSVSPPTFPSSLLAAIQKYDPSTVPIQSRDRFQNPFIGKNILVICGGNDKLVPWSASKKFVEELQVGDGVLKLYVEEDAGHECTTQMIKELSNFIWAHGIREITQLN